MDDPIDYRELRPADVEPFRELRLRSLREDPDAFLSTYDEELEMSAEQWLQRLRRRETDPACMTIGALAAERLVGTIATIHSDRPRIRHKAGLVGMYVANESRQQGIGRRLVEEAIAHLRRVGGIELVQLAVVTTNAPALRLYTSAGFIAYGREPLAIQLGNGYLDEELMWMKL